MIDRILFFDSETNGRDPKVHEVVECAGSLWSLSMRSRIASFSFLVKASHNEAEGINRIPIELLKEAGVSYPNAMERLEAWFGKADIVVAHNADFDRGFLPGKVDDLRPWVCSCNDIEWPGHTLEASNALTSLCLENGVAVARSHRAMADVDLLEMLFERVGERHDLAAIIERAMRPRGRYIVADKGFSAERNEAAKAAGFRWDGERKQWHRRLAKEDVPQLMNGWSFTVVEAP